VPIVWPTFLNSPVHNAVTPDRRVCRRQFSPHGESDLDIDAKRFRYGFAHMGPFLDCPGITDVLLFFADPWNLQNNGVWSNGSHGAPGMPLVRTIGTGGSRLSGRVMMGFGATCLRSSARERCVVVSTATPRFRAVPLSAVLASYQNCLRRLAVLAAAAATTGTSGYDAFARVLGYLLIDDAVLFAIEPHGSSNAIR